MRQERPHSRRPDIEEDSPDPRVEGQQRRERLEDDTEDLLDEIDDVLEEDAAEFVRSYIQKSGQ